MWKSGTTETTRIGYINRNKQLNMGHRDVAGNDHVQMAYRIQCQVCGTEYGCNGSDIFQRKCPNCQGGQAGIDF